MSTKTKRDPTLLAFQEAARAIMRRIGRDARFAYVMYGTECYALILTAYALSLDKALPDLACTKPVADIWLLLHDA